MVARPVLVATAGVVKFADCTNPRTVALTLGRRLFPHLRREAVHLDDQAKPSLPLPFVEILRVEGALDTAQLLAQEAGNSRASRRLSRRLVGSLTGR